MYPEFNEIDKPDYTTNELNRFADFIEISAFFSKDKCVTYSDMQDRFFGKKEYNKNYPDREDLIFEDTEDNFSKNSENIASIRDKDEELLNSIFELIRERVGLYNIDYPFAFINNTLYLKQELTIKNKLYLSLLISSKLNIFRSFETNLTTNFEKISYVVLKEFLPKSAIIKEFGKNTQYKGNAISKIKQLASDLSLKIEEDELNCVNDRNQQERGLDIVGWLPFLDKCGNQVIFLCQCTCGKKYGYKQHDTRRFENYLKFYKTTPQHTLFIPYSLINVRNNKFYSSDDIEGDYLIFERKRIIEYYKYKKSESLEIFKIVDSFINNRN
jgi:hypothetical protein